MAGQTRMGTSAHARKLKNLTEKAHRAELRDPDSQVDQQPDYAKNDYRSIKEELFVAVGICTH